MLVTEPEKLMVEREFNINNIKFMNCESIVKVTQEVDKT